MKGFKSFADPTSLEFEPGVTVVVGPNGSGKSNVVDAIAWVLGAQGPRVVRSAKMDDVIFAGTQRRAALGRAEVSLTIDNSSHRLPIEFAEVTVTRTLFRSGESEYALNGAPCRLLDVQELLSDTGVGRQQHVLVGQGQLDAVLVARPEDRRAVIEEAAGVLKYRRRRERAERRLASSEQAQERLEDLLREVRRQIRPLERQASAARRHGALADELRGLSAYLAGRELFSAEESLAAGEKTLLAIEAQRLRASAELEGVEAELALAEQHEETSQSDELLGAIGRIDQLSERARGLQSVIAERRRARAELGALLRDPNSSQSVEEAIARLQSELAQASADSGRLEPAWSALARAQEALQSDEAEVAARYGESDEPNEDAAIARAETAATREVLGERREALARAEKRVGQLAARKASVAERLEAARLSAERLADRLEAAQADLAGAETEASAAGQSLEQASDELARSDELLHGLLARVEALELALDEARARAGAERLASQPGFLGTLLDVVEVAEPYGLAFEAAVEGLLGAVVISGTSQAREALEHLRSAGLSGAVLAASARSGPHRSGQEVLPGTERLLDQVRATQPEVAALLAELLADVLVCSGGFATSLELALEAPDRCIVSLDGDRFSNLGWRIGAGRAGVTRAALDKAKADLVGASEAAGLAKSAFEHQRQLERSRSARLAELTRRGAQLRAELDQAGIAAAEGARQHELVVADELAALVERDEIRAAIEDANAALAGLTGRLFVLEHEESERAQRAGEASALRQELAERAAELSSRRRDLELEMAALKERRSLLIAQREQLSAQLEERRELEQTTRQRVEDSADEELALVSLSSLLQDLLGRLADASAQCSGVLAEHNAAQSARRERLSALRRQREQLEAQLTSLRERHQRVEIAQAEQRVRREALLERITRELDLSGEQVLLVELPELEAGVAPGARRDELARELESLGPINPLASAELDEATERSSFLAGQLEDVKNARRELNQVIAAIDQEIVEIFTAAYADVARHFESLIETLFPGGSGALSLSSPGDLLETGVEIEARPAGRNVRRLSLLSGGERALVALAFLFAVFRSRPSPFYVMDEVEAALDEVNLQRFLNLVEEFRDEAQLIIVSHQKKTMEVADALYGISMQPGGASKVVSERLRAPKADPLGLIGQSAEVP